MRHLFTIALASAAVLLTQPGEVSAQTSGVTSPAQAFGFPIGADYSLINYDQAQEYWRRIDAESDRVQVVSLGKTAEGRDQLMAIVSSPENLAKLDTYKSIARRLARAENLTEAQALELAHEGKPVVWIDGGLHSTETVGAQQITQTLYELVNGDDAETTRLRNDLVILLAFANPDGMNLVSNWYMRNADPAQREMRNIPTLYQKYVGHDNNRDFYMSNMPENININNALYREWFPQIVFNHHQTGPEGMVVFIPPFRDPFNYNLDPLVILGLDGVGAAMNTRLISEGKAGSGRRSVATYSNWTSGTLRSTALFHNSVGILTEIIGDPTPYDLPLVARQQLARNDLPMPIAPQKWHFMQSIEYSLSMNRAVLDYASRNAEAVQMSIYRMGANGIESGQRDSWTTTPKDIARLEAAARSGPAFAPTGARYSAGGAGTVINPTLYDTVLHAPEARDPRGYVIPADQADLPTAVAFVNVLIKGGVDVERATSTFTVGGKTYPAGSYVVKTAQAYRANILDMFEPQDHPDDIPFPGAAPTPPYDVSGYTLAYQMGVKFDRILDGFDGPFQRVNDVMAPPPGEMSGRGRAGFIISHEVNNTFIVQNRLLKAGAEVFWLSDPITVDGQSFGPGALWIPAGEGVRDIVAKGAQDLGVDVHAVASAPRGERLKLAPVRIGLVDKYGGVMPSGWMRWLFEQYEFDFDVVFPQEIDAGGLKDRYDVLVFSTDSIASRRASSQPAPETIPAEFRPMLGTITPERSTPQLAAFVRAGGSIVAIGNSTSLASQLGLPVRSALVETGPGGETVELPPAKFFIPGAIMTNKVDPSDPLAYGMSDTVDIYFHNSPSFLLGPATADASVRPVAWFASPDTLRSGWAWGQAYLDKSVSIVDARLGQGRVFLMGPEVVQRAQSHGTYKFLFNALMFGPAEAKAKSAD
ncbi:MAG: peptidase [Brevundimonas sp.]|nr:MAG: peptidase [Brevundimonas sp.]